MCFNLRQVLIDAESFGDEWNGGMGEGRGVGEWSRAKPIVVQKVSAQ